MNTENRNVTRHVCDYHIKNKNAGNTNMLAVGGYQHSAAPIIDADSLQAQQNTIRPRACEEVIVA